MLHDSVRSSLHVADCGGGAVSGLGCFACGACVGGIETNAVGPAVVDGGTIGASLSGIVVMANVTWGVLVSPGKVSLALGLMTVLAR